MTNEIVWKKVADTFQTDLWGWREQGSSWECTQPWEVFHATLWDLDIILQPDSHTCGKCSLMDQGFDTDVLRYPQDPGSKWLVSVLRIPWGQRLAVGCGMETEPVVWECGGCRTCVRSEAGVPVPLLQYGFFYKEHPVKWCRVASEFQSQEMYSFLLALSFS